MKKKELRTARLSVATAAQEALATIEIYKRLSELHDKYTEDIKKDICKADNIEVTLSGYDLSKILGALRDYSTLRIANIVDPNPSVKSLKDFPSVNLSKIRSFPKVKEVLDARDNWIGHINKRFIWPVRRKTLCSNEIVGLLEYINMLVCAEMIKEKE